VTNDTRSSGNLVQIVAIGALTGLAVAVLVYLVRYMSRRNDIDSASEIIDDCQDRILSLEQRLDERLASRMMIR
jgi:hypothetical protein